MIRQSCLHLILVILVAHSAVAQNRGKATGVIVSPVVRGEFSDRIEGLGTTKANESIIVTADQAEKISAIHFEDGQEVKQGALLVSLNKAQEEAELRAAEALTVEAQNAYNRARGLSGSSALPKATLQQRAAELKQSQAATEALKARLGSYQITAPFDGVLGLREVSVGALIRPGDIITTLDDLSQIKVDFDVPSVFLASLQPGLRIEGRVTAFNDRIFEGKVTTVNTQIDPVTRTIKIRAIIPNEEKTLKPGLLMTVELFYNTRRTLLIPEEALIKRGERNFVFAIAEENATLRAIQQEITIGARKPGTVEVLTGLKEGDKVVNHGTVKLRDGATVTIRAEETEDTPLDALLQQKPQAPGGT